jgi:acyl-CoA synthetase (AMP-forming)/AMP-acid ligase II
MMGTCSLRAAPTACSSLVARTSYFCEIEDIIYRLEGIGEAAIVSAPDDRLNEKMTAFVIASDNSLSEADIR